MLNICMTACSIVFGTVDWHDTYVNGCQFSLQQGPIIVLETVADNCNSKRAIAELKKIIGSKPIVCTGVLGNHGGFLHSVCYINARVNEHPYANVAEELHKRGF